MGSDVEVEEIGDAAEEDPVIEIADGSAEDEGEREAGAGEAAGGAPEQIADDDHGRGGKADEEWDSDARRPVGKEAEGGSGVFNVGDGEEVGDHLMAAEVEFDAVGNEDFGEAVAEDDDRRHR